MKNKEPYILVTGANGYIGSNTTKCLLEKGLNVIACDFNNTNISQNAKYIRINVLEEATNKNLYEELGQPTHLIHFAWQDGFNHNSSSHLENLHKHFNFIKNMIDNNIESVSIMGTMHEIGYTEGMIKESTPCNPLSMYGIAKNALRQAVCLYAADKNSSIKWLRAFYIYGQDEKNHSIFTKLIQAEKENKEFFPFTDGINFYDFIHIDELSKQIMFASLQNKIEGIINVCSGNPITLRDKVEAYIKDNNFKIKLQPGIFKKRKYDSPIVYGDNSKIMQILKDSIND